MSISAGRSWRWALMPVIALSSLATAQPAQEEARGLTAPEQAESRLTGDRWALLIGIDRYDHAQDLRFCAKDMESLADVLVRQGGYDQQRVRLLTTSKNSPVRPTRTNILIELDLVLKQAGPNDLVLVAFAGHGLLSESQDAYLMIQDSAPGAYLEQTGLRLSQIRESIEQCSARQKLLILDACHSGSKRGAPDVVAVEKLKPEMLPMGSGIIELYSCQGDQVSYEDENLGHGVFSYFLTQGLKGEADAQLEGNRDGLISSAELYAYAHALTGAHVARTFAAQQQPVQRGEVSGGVIVARARQDVEQQLSNDAVLERLQRLEDARRTTKGLHERARGLLEAATDFGPVERVRLGLELLARERITEAEFGILCEAAMRRLTSHNLARKRLEASRLAAVIVGAGMSEPLPRLPGASRDAQSLRDALTRVWPANASITLLQDREATAESVRQSIRSALSPMTEGDLLLVYFAGHSSSVKGKPSGLGLQIARGRPQGTWSLAADSEESPPPRVIRCTGEVDSPASTELGMQEIVELTRTTPANVLVVTDSTGGVWAAWPQSEALRLHIGYPEEVRTPDFILELGGAPLTSVLIQALLGRADQRSPMTFGHESNDFLPTPDGFVTARELTAYLNSFSLSTRDLSFDPTTTREEWFRFLIIGNEKSEVVVSRSTLPAE